MANIPYYCCIVPPLDTSNQATTFGETLSIDEYVHYLKKVEQKFTHSTAAKFGHRAMSHVDQQDRSHYDVLDSSNWKMFESHRFFIAANQHHLKDRMRR